MLFSAMCGVVVAGALVILKRSLQQAIYGIYTHVIVRIYRKKDYKFTGNFYHGKVFNEISSVIFIMTEYGEGDFQRAFLGFRNSDQLSNYLWTLGVSSAISGIRWYRENYNNIKSVADVGKSLLVAGQKTQMARFRRRNYKRTYGGRKRRRTYRRRRSFRRGRRSGRRAIRGIYKLLRRQGVRNVETKVVTGTTGAINTTEGKYNSWYAPAVGGQTNPTTLANLYLIPMLYGISEGDAKTQRTGNKIMVSKIRINGIWRAITGAPNEVMVSYLILRDKHPESADLRNWGVGTGNGPTLGDLYATIPFVEPATALSNEQRIDMMYAKWKYVDTWQSGRFSILTRGQFKIGSDTGNTISTIPWKQTIRVMQPCSYGNAAGTEAGKGMIYFVAWSNNTNFADFAQQSQIQVNGLYRVYFKDL